MYVVYFFFVYLSHLNFLSFSLLRAWGFGSETANNSEVRRQQRQNPETLKLGQSQPPLSSLPRVRMRSGASESNGRRYLPNQLDRFIVQNRVASSWFEVSVQPPEAGAIMKSSRPLPPLSSCA